MDQEIFNLEIRKYLKTVGLTSQHEIEEVVRLALENGDLDGDETLPVSVTLTMPSLNFQHEIPGEIKLN